MEKWNCDMFQLAISFDEKKFKHDIFRREIKTKDKNLTSYYVTDIANEKEHAHIEILLNKKDSLLLMMFHQGGIEKGHKTVVFEESLEDCAKEVSHFLPNTQFQADITAVFRFNEEFESLLKLQYPLLIGNEVLQQAVVSGHEIEFPNDSMVDRIFISAKKNSIIVVISAKLDIKLRAFKLYSAIENLSQYARALVKKGDNNE